LQTYFIFSSRSSLFNRSKLTLHLESTLKSTPSKLNGFWHRRHSKLLGAFTSAAIAYPSAESPCMRAHCPLHPRPGAGTEPTCALHHWKAPSQVCHLPDANGQNHLVCCYANRLRRSLQCHAGYRDCGICRSLPIIVPLRHARSAFSSQPHNW